MLGIQGNGAPVARWERDTRYYEMEIAHDLFGTLCIITTFGRIQSQLGRRRTLPFESGSDREAAWAALNARRLARGYTLQANSY